MTTFDQRLVNAVSPSELHRRWGLVRREMQSLGLDALVLQNSSDWVGGYLRWFSNQPATNGYSTALVFPLEGDLTMIEQGPFGGQFVSSPQELRSTGVGLRITTPAYPSIHYSGHYDAACVLAELDRLGARRVGIVAPAAMYHSFGLAVREGCRDRELVDATDLVDRMKAVKSPEELACVRSVAALQDAVMAGVAAHVRPGAHDFEIAAQAQMLAQQLGSEQGIFLCSSAPPGAAATFKPRYLQGRQLQAGDVFSLLIEVNGAGGFYTELSRLFVLGRASAALREAHATVLEAQRHAVSLLRPGVACAEVYERFNDWLRAHGLPPEQRLSIHGMGIDMVERPLVRHDESLAIEENMVIVVHPGIATAELFAHNTETYRIGANGDNECLHRTPRTIVEIDA
jgi:Xaa-Pro aminopeptidase